MKTLTIRDLLHGTLAAAVLVGTAKLSVTYRHSIAGLTMLLTGVSVAAPATVTAWLHFRISCSWAAGATLYYLVGLVAIYPDGWCRTDRCLPA